jgi:ferredoxin
MGAVYTVTIDDDGSAYRCPDHRSLLEGMEALGRKGIPVGCRNGGCGVCKVHITSGSYTRRVMSRAHVTEDEEAAGYALACRVKPTSDIRLAVVGTMKRNVCRTVEPADGLPLHST